MLKGTVTIGGAQAGVSALTGPNGWNALGFAELNVFDPLAENPALMAPGDSVRFIPARIEL
jgi:allophanate hydrolase subunit 1